METCANNTGLRERRIEPQMVVQLWVSFGQAIRELWDNSYYRRGPCWEKMPGFCHYYLKQSLNLGCLGRVWPQFNHCSWFQRFCSWRLSAKCSLCSWLESSLLQEIPRGSPLWCHIYPSHLSYILPLLLFLGCCLLKQISGAQYDCLSSEWQIASTLSIPLYVFLLSSYLTLDMSGIHFSRVLLSKLYLLNIYTHFFHFKYFSVYLYKHAI